MSKTLRIRLADGSFHETEAEIIGDLAVHRNKRGLWTVTHVPTMRSMASVMPEELKSAKTDRKAVRWATTVQKSRVKEWAAIRKLTARDVTDNPRASEGIREVIRQHCLATKS